MPTRPASPCSSPRCPNLKPCPVHPDPKPFESLTPRRRYGSSGYAWQRTVKQVVLEEPYCRLRLPGCTGRSETADHIVSPRQGGTDRRDNLRGACHHCNKERAKQQVAEGRQR